MAPSLEQVHRAINKARAAGDAEAEQILLMDLADATQETAKAADRTRVESMGTGGRLLAGVGQGMTNIGMNLGDIAANVPGLGGLRPSPETWQEFARASEPLKETTAGKVGAFAGETAATLPVGTAAGKLLGTAGGQLLGRTAPVARFLTRPLAQAMTQGAAEGAVLGGPDNRGVGALVGAAGGAGAVGLGAAARRAYRGVAQPSAAARFLERQGVQDLTLGQMAPRSALGQLEEAATSIPFLGAGVRAQREAGEAAVQSAALRMARAPGSSLGAGQGSIAGRLSAIYDDFERAYDPIRNQAVRPAIATGPGTAVPLRTALRAAVQDPAALATAETVARVGRFLENEASILGKRTAQQATGTGGMPFGPAVPASAAAAWGRAAGAQRFIPADDLLKLRSNIRTAAREALQREDYPAARLLGNAENAVTRGLDSQLPEPLRQALRATDTQYAKFKIVSDAVRRSGDRPSGFTMTELGAAVRKSTEPGSYARGAGGPLRRLAAAGRETLDQRVPLTGARMYLTPAALATAPLTTTKAGKALLTGTTRPQRAAQLLETALRRSLGREGRRRARGVGQAIAGYAGARQAKEED
jgi:hypothetical protein